MIIKKNIFSEINIKDFLRLEDFIDYFDKITNGGFVITYIVNENEKEYFASLIHKRPHSDDEQAFINAVKRAIITTENKVYYDYLGLLAEITKKLDKNTDKLYFERIVCLASRVVSGILLGDDTYGLMKVMSI